MNSGVYKIHFNNGKCYVGSSNNLAKRNYEHLRTLTLGTHHNRYLQRAFNKIGKNSYQFEILELCLVEMTREREQYWLEKLSSCDPDKGYNLVPNANEAGTSGYKLSPEQKQQRLLILKQKVWNKKQKNFKFVSPDGKIVEVFGLRRFCQENNLAYKTMGNIHRGVGVTCQGWRKYQEDGFILHHKGSNFILINKDDEKKIGNNLKATCKEMGLSYESIRKGCWSAGWKKYESQSNDNI